MRVTERRAEPLVPALQIMDSDLQHVPEARLAHRVDSLLPSNRVALGVKWTTTSVRHATEFMSTRPNSHGRSRAKSVKGIVEIFLKWHLVGRYF
jgi:hypothetical protein